MRATFQRKVDLLAEIFDFLGRFFAANPVNASERHLIEMAVEEIFTNMVKYNPTGDGSIRIDIDRKDDCAVIGLTDFDTEPFDITAVPEVDVNKALEDRKPGGLGVHLVNKLMDHVGYEYKGREATITMIKRLPPC